MPHNSERSKAEHPLIVYARALGPKNVVPVAPRTKFPSIRTRGGDVLRIRWSRPRTMEQIEQWAEDPALGVGIVCGDILGLDIDVNDSAFADKIEALAFDCLGLAPVRIRDGSPRRLLVYRQTAGDPPIKKRRLAWLDAQGDKQACELLAHGQFFVAHGIHPSGGRYRWRGESLVGVGPENLSELDAALLGRLFQC